MCSEFLNKPAVLAGSGRAVRSARRAAGLSVRALADRVGVSPATVSAVENGHTELGVSRLLQFAAALGVPPARLLGLDDDPAEPPAPARPGGPAPWRRFAPPPIDPVLAGAIDCFVDMGYHGTSMRTLAARIGVSVPAIYHHYADKQQLLVRSLDLTMDELEWRIAAARAEARDGLQEVALIVEVLALFHTYYRKLAFIGATEMRSLQGTNRSRIAKRRRNVQRILDGAIDRARREGRLATRHPRAAGRAIATMCTALPQWFRDTGPLTAEDIARAYVEFALAMLGATNAPGRT
mgnify:FL=1